jgi:hypothetical protein
MNKTLFLYLSQTRTYWWFRKVLLRISFWFERKVFGVRHDIKDEINNYSSLRSIFGLIDKPLFIAIGFAGFLQYIDPHLHSYFQKVNLHVPEDTDYVTFLAAISSIGGIFIGLYYTGISVVGGAIYAKVPNDIRGLLARERLGNVYMRFLSFLTFLCLVLIALRISSLPRIYVAVPIVTLAAGIGIFSFVKLGQRAFNLFDPTALSYHIFEQLQHWLETVKAGGFLWMDNSFQHHAYRQASAELDTLETLADLTAKEIHLNGSPFINLSKNILKFLIYYEHAKCKIPTDSRWYEQQYQHPDWYCTDDSRVSIAYQTGTAIQPDVTSNNKWIEDRVLKVITRCIKVNLTTARYSEVLDLFQYLNAYIGSLAIMGELDRAFSLLEVLVSTVVDAVAKEPVEVEVLENLSIIQQSASLTIVMALEYRKSLEKLNRQNIVLRIASIRWGNNSSIYNVGFPAYCLSRLEWFRPRLAFEEEVEGHQITPAWYKLELILQVEAEQFVSNVGSLVSKGIEFYTSIFAKLTNLKRPWLAATIMSQELEYWDKIEHQLEMWPEKWAELSQHLKIEGLQWPPFDIEALRKEINLRRKELLKTMSQQNILLALNQRPDGFPDYAGQFLHTSGEVALDALLINDAELLKNVFKPYLVGCLIRFDSLRPKSGSIDWRAQQDFKIASAALLDAMDISGYAKLLADYHGNESLWREVAVGWDEYLTAKADLSPIPTLFAAIALTDAAFEIPHRGILRTTWLQKINQRLQDVPRHEEYHRGYIGSDTEIDHESALVRIFAREPYGSFHNGIDIFITFYLCNLKDAKDLDFGWKRRDLQDTIERENQRTDKARKKQ